MPPTDHSSERARIIEAAYRVLAASNGASVSVNDILAEAGLSTRAFYRNFESKDSLLRAMFRRDSERVLTELQAAASAAPTAREALRSWVVGMLRVPADPRRRQRALVLMSDEVTRAKGHHVERARYHAGQDAAIAQILHRGREDGSFPLTRPESDAPLIRAALHQALEDQWSASPPIGVAEAVETVFDFALRALGAAGGTSRGTTATAPSARGLY